MRWIAVVGMVLGCNAIAGISEHERAPEASSGGASATGGKTSAQGGKSTTTRGGSAGTSSEGGAPSIEGGGPPIGEGGAAPVGCKPGVRTCSGNVVVECQANEWVPVPPAEQCAGATPACTGEGLCAAWRLREGSLASPGAYPIEANGPNYVLVQQSLLSFPTTCGTKYCVTGGIRP